MSPGPPNSNGPTRISSIAPSRQRGLNGRAAASPPHASGPHSRSGRRWAARRWPSDPQSPGPGAGHPGLRRPEGNSALAGAPGVGHPHRAMALGGTAIQCGYSAAFTSLDALGRPLRPAAAGGQGQRELKTSPKPALPIVGEGGCLPWARKEASLVFPLGRGGDEPGALMLTSNKTWAEWSEVVGDEGVATARLDRLLHPAAVFSMPGPSSRPRAKRLGGGPQGPAPAAPGASDHAQKGGDSAASLSAPPP
jgi:hypothetical protein